MAHSGDIRPIIHAKNPSSARRDVFIRGMVEGHGDPSPTCVNYAVYKLIARGGYMVVAVDDEDYIYHALCAGIVS